MSLIFTLLATLLALGILITVHEWGHYWVARRCGVKVLRFSVGFGKPLWKRVGADGTEYCVAAIPLGGYVKMLDEREGDVPAELASSAFNNKTVWQRIAIVAAGPGINLLFAVLAYWFIFVLGVTVVKPVVGSVDPGSLAERAGLEPNIEIFEVDGRPVRSWEEINLALAARLGEEGIVEFRAGDPAQGWTQTFSTELNQWSFELDAQSPLSAFGFVPWRPQIEPVLGEIQAGGAAERAGLQTGDRVITVNDQPIEDWNALVDKIQAAPSQLLLFGIERDSSFLQIEVRPGERELSSGEIVGYIGSGVVMPQWPDEMLVSLSQNPFDALVSGIEKTGQMISLTLDAIWKMIVGAISVKNLSGPITIAKVAGDSAASGLESFVSFLAYLSISLGVLNLLPIPMLDGGHLVYYFVEVIRKKPVSERIQMVGMKIGMALLFGLMSLAFINDLARL